MQVMDPKARYIWKQNTIPVLFRRMKPDPLLVKLPYAVDNYEWLRNDHHHKPKWNSQYKAWETPISWFDDIVQRTLSRFGKLYVIQAYKEQQKCAPACWNAKGYHCECSCMGENHGVGHPGGRWHEVDETFAFEWGPLKYACRLMSASKIKKP